MAKKKKEHTGNKYAALSEPQAEFDFHGRGVLTPNEICDLAKSFLLECQKQGLQRVLLITGKGLHSRGDGPVVKPVLQDFLPFEPYVRSVTLARRDRGGAGALEVTLV